MYLELIGNHIQGVLKAVLIKGCVGIVFTHGIRMGKWAAGNIL